MLKDIQGPEAQRQAEFKAARGMQLAAFLRDQVGKPFKYAPSLSEIGTVFDCSSLVQAAYASVGIGIPRTAINQATYAGGRPVLIEEELEIGDVIYLTSDVGYYNEQYPMGIGHSGTYVGDGRVATTRSEYIDREEVGQVVEIPSNEFLDREDCVVVIRIFDA